MYKGYISISEFAKNAGVSVQNIYQRLNTSLKPYLKIIQGKKYINVEALQLFHHAENLNSIQENTENLNNTLTKTLIELDFTSKKSAELEEKIKLKDLKIIELESKITEKETQLINLTQKILELSEQVMILADQQQKLTAMQQTSKTNFFKRLFLKSPQN